MTMTKKWQEDIWLSADKRNATMAQNGDRCILCCCGSDCLFGMKLSFIVTKDSKETLP